MGYTSNHSVRVVSLMVVVAGLPVRAAQAQSAPVLIGPTYPSAIAVPFESESESQRDSWRFNDGSWVFTEHTRSFYAKDPIDRVRSFYDAEVGATQNGSLSYLRVPEGMRSETMRPGPYVYSVVLGRNDNSDLLGVQLRALEPRDGSPYNFPVVGPFFKKLLTAQAGGQAAQDDVSRAIEEHEHLAWRFYPLTDERSAKGKRLTTDQVVLRKCEADLGGGLTQEELGAQMQAAGQKGDMAELQRLSQMVSGTTGSGSWAGWIDCLGELEGAGYQTLITIDLRP